MSNRKLRLRPMSITWRVLLFVALTVTICLSLMASLLNSSINHHFLQQDAGELEVMTHAIEHQLQGNFISNDELAVELEKAVSGHHGVYFQVRDSLGPILYTSPELDLTNVTIDINAKKQTETS